MLVPKATLGVVGIDGNPTSEFLIRTQGVALVTMAALVVLVPIDARPRTRGALLALAGYLIVGSIVDLRAFADGIVGLVSVPSAAVRLSVGVICVLAAVSRGPLHVSGSRLGPESPSPDGSDG